VALRVSLIRLFVSLRRSVLLLVALWLSLIGLLICVGPLVGLLVTRGSALVRVLVTRRVTLVWLLPVGTR
jgi:hypothetical protein